MSSSKPVPLDASRWVFAPPKISPKDLQDPPGFSFVNEKEEAASSGRGNTNNNSILEKVCLN